MIGLNKKINRKEKCFFFQSPSLLSFTTALCRYIQHCLLFCHASLLPPCAPASPLYYYFLLISPDLPTGYFLSEYGLETSFNTCKCSSLWYHYILYLLLGWVQQWWDHKLLIDFWFVTLVSYLSKSVLDWKSIVFQRYSRVSEF